MKIFLIGSLLTFTFIGAAFSADPASVGNNSLLFEYTINEIDKADDDIIQKQFNISPGKLLDIDLKTGGSINVKGWDKNVVDVKISRRGRDAKYVQIDFENNDDEVRIHSYYTGKKKNRNSDIDFEIFVPKKFNLEFETMGGKVTLNNIEGTLNGQTMGGGLNLSSLKGDINLKTMGGSIELKDSEVDGKVETMGGRVLIEDVTGDIKGSSMGGNVEYRNVKRRGEASANKAVKISTMGGAINVDDAPSGADVHTMGGDITINSAGKFVKAKTMGGDIEVKEVNGDIEATTMGGEIHVKMLGDSKTTGREIHLTSMSGDIVLLVPKNFSMSIDAEVEAEDDDEFKIISDFDIKKRKLKRDDDEEYIHGTAKINGGNNRVVLEARHGDIRIEGY